MLTKIYDYLCYPKSIVVEYNGKNVVIRKIIGISMALPLLIIAIILSIIILWKLNSLSIIKNDPLIIILFYTLLFSIFFDGLLLARLMNTLLIYKSYLEKNMLKKRFWKW